MLTAVLSGDWGGRAREGGCGKGRRGGGKEERRGVDRASSSKLIPGAPTSQGPRQTQSSDLLDSPNGVGPIFFASAPSSLALSPLGPAPSTVQDGCRPCVAATVGLGSRLWGVPNGDNGPHLQPASPRPSGEQGGPLPWPVLSGLSALAAIHPRRVIVHSRRGRSHLPPVVLVACRVSPFQSQPSLGMQRSGPDTGQEKPNTPVSAKCTMHRWMLTRYPCIR